VDPILIALLSGVVALAVAGFMARYVLKQDEGSAKIREISTAIKEGALAFIGREYRVMSIFVAVVAVILGVVPSLGWLVSLAFVFGAICSQDGRRRPEKPQPWSARILQERRRHGHVRRRYRHYWHEHYVLRL